MVILILKTDVIYPIISLYICIVIKKKPPSQCQNDSSFDSTHDLVAVRLECERFINPHGCLIMTSVFIYVNLLSCEYEVSKTEYFQGFAYCLFDDGQVARGFCNPFGTWFYSHGNLFTLNLTC